MKDNECSLYTHLLCIEIAHARDNGICHRCASPQPLNSFLNNSGTMIRICPTKNFTTGSFDMLAAMARSTFVNSSMIYYMEIKRFTNSTTMALSNVVIKE